MRRVIHAKYALGQRRSGEKQRAHDEAASLLRLEQRFTSFSVPPSQAWVESGSELPSIRLLFVSHQKDFDVLPYSVFGAYRHVKNPITTVDIVSPSPSGVESVLENRLPGNLKVSYWHDGDVLPDKLRRVLKRELPTHGSWAAQQLIKVLMAIQNSQQPTLVIDSDTVLLRDKVWLRPDQKQLLYSRAFLNTRYQQFLEAWGLREPDYLRSFVTHHMLYQPAILNNAISHIFGSSKAEILVNKIITSAQELGFPEFSLDYELYGNVLWSKHKHSYYLDKFSNLGLARPKDDLTLKAILSKLRRQKRYNSVSFHLPNR